jgi:hypothetical protein
MLSVHSRLADPKDGDPSLVKRDVANGLVRPLAARDIYGVDGQ